MTDLIREAKTLAKVAGCGGDVVVGKQIYLSLQQARSQAIDDCIKVTWQLSAEMDNGSSIYAIQGWLASRLEAEGSRETKAS